MFGSPRGDREDPRDHRSGLDFVDEGERGLGPATPLTTSARPTAAASLAASAFAPAGILATTGTTIPAAAPIESAGFSRHSTAVDARGRTIRAGIRGRTTGTTATAGPTATTAAAAAEGLVVVVMHEVEDPLGIHVDVVVAATAVMAVGIEQRIVDREKADRLLHVQMVGQRVLERLVGRLAQDPAPFDQRVPVLGTGRVGLQLVTPGVFVSIGSVVRERATAGEVRRDLPSHALRGAVVMLRESLLICSTFAHTPR